MEIIYRDGSVVVCLKPPGVLSTDEEGGMPGLLREKLNTSEVFTVHRLDRVVSGLMVYALSPSAASELARQVREKEFSKQYLAVIHWRPHDDEGTFRDLLLRDTYERRTRVVRERTKEAREAVLNYSLLDSRAGLSLVKIDLVTGRTHQIRVQFSSRALPLVGDKKYSPYNDDCPIALFSHRLGFSHPESGERLEFSAEPPDIFPWSEFA